MEAKIEIFYTLNEASSIIEHPLTDSSEKLIKFLRRYGILNEMMPKPELIAREFFTLEFQNVELGNVNKYAPVVRVSNKGIFFIRNLLQLIYDEE